MVQAYLQIESGSNFNSTTGLLSNGSAVLLFDSQDMFNSSNKFQISIAGKWTHSGQNNLFIFSLANKNDSTAGYSCYTHSETRTSSQLGYVRNDNGNANTADIIKDDSTDLVDVDRHFSVKFTQRSNSVSVQGYNVSEEGSLSALGGSTSVIGTGNPKLNKIAIEASANFKPNLYSIQILSGLGDFAGHYIAKEARTFAGTKIQLRHDTAANWTSVNPILAAGEMGVETDTNKFKFGNGTSTWSELAYATSGSSGGGSGTQLTSADGTTEYSELALGDTLAVSDGVLNANLDELGNEVNTLSSRVTTNETNIEELQNTTIKQDTILAPLTCNTNPVVPNISFSSDYSEDDNGYISTGTTTVVGEFINASTNELKIEFDFKLLGPKGDANLFRLANSEATYLFWKGGDQFVVHKNWKTPNIALLGVFKDYPVPVGTLCHFKADLKFNTSTGSFSRDSSILITSVADGTVVRNYNNATISGSGITGIDFSNITTVEVMQNLKPSSVRITSFTNPDVFATDTNKYLQLKYDNNTIKVNESGELYADIPKYTTMQKAIPFPLNLTSNGTLGGSTPSCTGSSYEMNPDHPYYYAFKGATTSTPSSELWGPGSGSAGQYLILDCVTPIALQSFRWTNGGTDAERFPVIVFKGSNDNSNYTTLATYNTQNATDDSVTINNTTAYRYYKFEFPEAANWGKLGFISINGADEYDILNIGDGLEVTNNTIITAKPDNKYIRFNSNGELTTTTSVLTYGNFLDFCHNYPDEIKAALGLN